MSETESVTQLFGLDVFEDVLARYGDATIDRVGIEETTLHLTSPLADPVGNERVAFLVTIHCENLQGCGEAAPAWWIGDSDLPSVQRDLQRWAHGVAGSKLATWLGDAGDVCLRSLTATPAARAAIQCAAIDALARAANASVAQLIAGPNASSAVPVSALLGSGDEAFTAQAARQARDAGVTRLKLKVGGSPVSDRARIDAVLANVGPETRVRLDANRGWSFEKACQALDGLDAARIEFIEEPLLVADVDQLAALYAQTGIAIAIDESLATGDQLDTWLGVPGIEVFVLKPSRLGGVWSAALIAARIDAAGSRSVITDSIEGATGTRAAVHLAAAWGNQSAVGLGGRALSAAKLKGETAVACGPGLDTRFGSRFDSTAQGEA
ncbi:MAG: o-succinylbenzoate synthase [Planctomycetota bacterium]